MKNLSNSDTQIFTSREDSSVNCCVVYNCGDCDEDSSVNCCAVYNCDDL